MIACERCQSKAFWPGTVRGGEQIEPCTGIGLVEGDQGHTFACPFWQAHARATRAGEYAAQKSLEWPIPEIYRTATLESLPLVSPELEPNYREFYAKAEHFTKTKTRPSGLLITGQAGCGKTHLACAIANVIHRRSAAPVGFASGPELLARHGDAMRRGEEGTNAFLESLVRFAVFVVDDVDKCRSSDFAGEVLFEVVNRRYNSNRFTVLTANADAGEESRLSRQTSLAIIGRLTERGERWNLPRIDLRKPSRQYKQQDFAESGVA